MGEDNEAKAWIASQAENSQDALRLMASMPTLVRSSSGNYQAVQKVSWQKLVDLDSLTSKATTLASDLSLSDDEKDTAKSFLIAMEKGR